MRISLRGIVSGAAAAALGVLAISTTGNALLHAGQGARAPGAAVIRSAEIDPAILHHYPPAAVTVADADPAILHHYPPAAMALAGIDPDILHHYPPAAVTLAEADPEILHHYPPA